MLELLIETLSNNPTLVLRAWDSLIEYAIIAPRSEINVGVEREYSFHVQQEVSEFVESIYASGPEKGQIHIVERKQKVNITILKKCDVVLKGESAKPFDVSKHCNELARNLRRPIYLIRTEDTYVEGTSGDVKGSLKGATYGDFKKNWFLTLDKNLVPDAIQIITGYPDNNWEYWDGLETDFLVQGEIISLEEVEQPIEKVESAIEEEVIVGIAYEEGMQEALEHFFPNFDAKQLIEFFPDVAAEVLPLVQYWFSYVDDYGNCEAPYHGVKGYQHFTRIENLLEAL